MEYKGYRGRVEFDDEAGVIHGEVSGLRDVVTFRGTSVEEVRRAFEESVDDYLAFCRERGEEPEPPAAARVVVTVPPDLHRAIETAARVEGVPPDVWIARRLPELVAPFRDSAHSRRNDAGRPAS